MRLMFNGKEYSPSQPMAGDGLSQNGGTLNVDNPNRGILTQAEFSALTEEQKASGTYLVDDGRGGSSGWETYSTEERRIGTWIDGKPIYRKTIYQIPATVSSLNGILLADNVDTLIKQLGILPLIKGGAQYPFPYRNGTDVVISELDASGILSLRVAGSWGAYTFQATFEYTKTTDQGVGA